MHTPEILFVFDAGLQKVGSNALLHRSNKKSSPNNLFWKMRLQKVKNFFIIWKIRKWTIKHLLR
ncbi:hypothetical protein RT99_08765 [Flavobacterium sp. MEB061]|nr:hypothetical protein RT99_08765 [Flavobacterium sp. MEB061]